MGNLASASFYLGEWELPSMTFGYAYNEGPGAMYADGTIGLNKLSSSEGLLADLKSKSIINDMIANIFFSNSENGSSSYIEFGVRDNSLNWFSSETYEDYWDIPL